MAFTFKGYQAGRKARATKSGPEQKAQAVAAPTFKAGAKNSNGPKGGSSKSSVPANRTYLKTNNKGAPAKVSKVTKADLDTTPKTPFNRSSRLNYRQLKKSK